MRTVIKTAILLAAFAVRQGVSAQEAAIQVQADQVVHPISRLLTGVCIEDVNHEIYGGLYSQMIFGESFQEPAPAPEVNDFKAYGGIWRVHDGVLDIAGLDGPKLVSHHAAFRDGAVGAELFFADRQGENAGLIVRVDRPGVGADNFMGYEVSLDPARQTLRLGRHRNNFEPIKDVPCEVATNRWIPLEVRLAGAAIEILVDGRSRLRYDDGAAGLSAGTVGLRAWHCAAKYRNLWVKIGGQVESRVFKSPGEAPEISGLWRGVRRGSATGHYALTSARPFVGEHSQQMSFDSGDGEWGVENQGLNRWGLNFVAGRNYEGCVWVRAGQPTTLFVSLESRDGRLNYAETPLAVNSNGWQRLNFTLIPKAADQAGRFAIKLKQPGSVTLGYVRLQPGEWGRFKGLPVRRDVAEALIAEGVTVLRYGGSMVNNDGYRWKHQIGPRDRRPPYSGTWYRYSSNGWGIPDFMNFCEAAGFECVPDFNLDETPQDLADFIEYAKGPADSEWGRRRVADGHPQPYRLHYLELGNEERVDEKYAEKFGALAQALWAKDPSLILVVGDFAYDQPVQDPFHFAGAASRITNLAGQQRILQLAKEHHREVWFDVHVGTESPVPFNASLDGMFSFYNALDKIADGAKHRVVVFELNAGNHAQKRALANALAINAIARDGRVPVVCSANGLQPDGQNDNGWDQGLLFLNPWQVWLQPPGYAARMFSWSYEPRQVRCDVTGKILDANAARSGDGQTLVLQIVNPGEKAIATQIHIAGFVSGKPVAQVAELAGPLNAINTADQTNAIVPRQMEWTPGITEGTASHSFPPHSFTVIRFDH